MGIVNDIIKLKMMGKYKTIHLKLLIIYRNKVYCKIST